MPGTVAEELELEVGPGHNGDEPGAGGNGRGWDGGEKSGVSPRVDDGNYRRAWAPS